jgi:hypothetical protein
MARRLPPSASADRLLRARPPRARSGLAPDAWGGFAALALALTTAGCASVNPVLAPARVLRAERFAVEAGGGYSALVADPVLDNARAANARLAQGTAQPGDEATLVRAALLYGPAPPGVAPYVAARVGTGNLGEAQLALAGRVLRLGVRRVFWSDELWAFSLGVQARGALVVGLLDGVVPGLGVQESRLLGGDVVALLGRTSSELYDLYVGVRAGYTYGDSTMSLVNVAGGMPFGASGHRIDVAGVLGLRVGFGRLAGVMELDATGMWLWGRTSTGLDGSTSALLLIPSAALSYSF